MENIRWADFEKNMTKNLPRPANAIKKSGLSRTLIN